MLAMLDNVPPFKPSVGPKTVFPNFDPTHRTFTDDGMRIEFNHDIPMRDNIKLRADIYLPQDAPQKKKLPIVLAVTPYGKQNPFDVSAIPPSREFDPGFSGVSQSKYAPFEGSDPVFWTRREFAYVVVDSRGSFASEGEKANFVSRGDGEDAHDVIEYLGTRDWSNGHIGMIGASALGAIQWQAAALRPQHLSGILVQDGYTDLYREVAFKGGIPHLNFVRGLDDIYRSHGNKQGSPVLDLTAACAQHPDYDEFWELYTPKIDEIACPVYVVSSLADNGLHTPGSIRGWLAAKSELKYLELHPYQKWEWQLTPESLERQVAFFSRVLHGKDEFAAESVGFWPTVRLHVTEKHYAGSWRSEDAYPLSRTIRTKFYLGSDQDLTCSPVPTNATVTYQALTESASWKTTFSKPTEITGSARLRLRFTVGTGATDADIFVTLQKHDRNGKIVHFPYHTFINDGHVAYGWLRASKRALADRSWGDEVTHTFRSQDLQPLQPGIPVDLDINIQPSATLFRRGESLSVVVQGRDFGTYSETCQIPRAGTGINRAGNHSIWIQSSFLELPIIPKRL